VRGVFRSSWIYFHLFAHEPLIQGTVEEGRDVEAKAESEDLALEMQTQMQSKRAGAMGYSQASHP